MSEVQGQKRVIRPAQVGAKCGGVSVCTVWRYVRTNPQFPRPSKLSARVTVFDEAEVDAWLASRAGAPASAK